MKLITTFPKNENSLAPEVANEILIQTVAKIHCTAFGITIGILCGAGIFFITNILIVIGSDDVESGRTIFTNLNQYFFGYTITYFGSFVGLLYGLVTGFVLGWIMAFLRNFLIRVYLYIVKFRARLVSVNNFIDYP